jgi:hypothetical protein
MVIVSDSFHIFTHHIMALLRVLLFYYFFSTYDIASAASQKCGERIMP